MNDANEDQRDPEDEGDEDKDAPLPLIETRPRHRRSVRGALVLAALGFCYLVFLFTRDA